MRIQTRGFHLQRSLIFPWEVGTMYSLVIEKHTAKCCIRVSFPWFLYVWVLEKNHNHQTSLILQPPLLKPFISPSSIDSFLSLRSLHLYSSLASSCKQCWPRMSMMSGVNRGLRNFDLQSKGWDGVCICLGVMFMSALVRSTCAHWKFDRILNRSCPMLDLQAVTHFYYVAAECFDLKLISACKLSHLLQSHILSEKSPPDRAALMSDWFESTNTL